MPLHKLVSNTQPASAYPLSDRRRLPVTKQLRQRSFPFVSESLSKTLLLLAQGHDTTPHLRASRLSVGVTRYETIGVYLC